MLVPLLIAAVVGYLLGSLPFGYLVARAKGVNIFEVGSKNPGATNVRRVLGHGPGNLVLFLDALKGAAAAGWPLVLCLMERPRNYLCGNDLLAAWTLGMVGLVGAILGHSFSCFTKFRGGKSVATGAGGFAVIFPLGMLIAFGVFAVTVALGRMISLGSILGALALALAAVVLGQPLWFVVVCAVVALFVIYRHRANIGRILAGTESRIGQKKKEEATR